MRSLRSYDGWAQAKAACCKTEGCEAVTRDAGITCDGQVKMFELRRGLEFVRPEQIAQANRIHARKMGSTSGSKKHSSALAKGTIGWKERWLAGLKERGRAANN